MNYGCETILQLIKIGLKLLAISEKAFSIPCCGVSTL